mgnify:CR=1 FL=1
MQNAFPKLSETPGKLRHVGPVLGEHNEEIYRDLGVSSVELTELKIQGIV